MLNIKFFWKNNTRAYIEVFDVAFKSDLESVLCTWLRDCFGDVKARCWPLAHCDLRLKQMVIKGLDANRN